MNLASLRRDNAREERDRLKLLRKGLRVVKIPEAEAEVAMRQLRPILNRHVERFSAWLSVRDQMERLALDVYTQGLIDGNQIPKVDP